MLPIAFIVTLELIRLTVVEKDIVHYGSHIVLAVFTVLAVIAFTSVMFRLIDRAHRQVVRQNRELAAVNAVSTAIQGELGVDEIIDAVLEKVIASSGATEASVAVFSPDGQPLGEGGSRRALVAPEHVSPSRGVGSTGSLLIDVPLSTATSTVGRMRLNLPGGSIEPDLLASATLQNIGHQLASSIQTGQLVADLRRRQQEGHGLYDVLLQISNQNALADTLAAVARHARDLLASDGAVLCLNDATTRAVQLDWALSGTAPVRDGLCISPEADRFHDRHDHRTACPVRSSPKFRESLRVPIHSRDRMLGELWLGRSSDVPFTERDRRFLATLSDLASIAITSARMRESENQSAILAERERIAREMHDSLAQVLGVTHLRLRALGSRADVGSTHAIAGELAELADLSEEAYRDVREAILDLRESSRADRGLLNGLRAYLAKYSHQCGIATSLETTLDHDLALPPRSEIQVIRVIQEALTNVRKHSGAKSAVVRIAETDGTATFAVEDDGHGFDLNGALRRDGFGLHAMRERMELIRGALVIDSAPGRGTRVVASVPGVPVPVEVSDAGS